MPLRVVCNECETSFKVAAKYAGRKVKCAACGASLKIPAAEATDTAVSKPAPQKSQTRNKSDRRPKKQKKEAGTSSNKGQEQSSPWKGVVAFGASALMAFLLIVGANALFSKPTAEGATADSTTDVTSPKPSPRPSATDSLNLPPTGDTVPPETNVAASDEEKSGSSGPKADQEDPSPARKLDVPRVAVENFRFGGTYDAENGVLICIRNGELLGYRDKFCDGDTSAIQGPVKIADGSVYAIFLRRFEDRTVLLAAGTGGAIFILNPATFEVQKKIQGYQPVKSRTSRSSRDRQPQFSYDRFASTDDPSDPYVLATHVGSGDAHHLIVDLRTDTAIDGPGVARRARGSLCGQFGLAALTRFDHRPRGRNWIDQTGRFFLRYGYIGEISTSPEFFPVGIPVPLRTPDSGVASNPLPVNLEGQMIGTIDRGRWMIGLSGEGKAVEWKDGSNIIHPTYLSVTSTNSLKTVRRFELPDEVFQEVPSPAETATTRQRPGSNSDRGHSAWRGNSSGIARIRYFDDPEHRFLFLVNSRWGIKIPYDLMQLPQEPLLAIDAANQVLTLGNSHSIDVEPLDSFDIKLLAAPEGLTLTDSRLNWTPSELGTFYATLELSSGDFKRNQVVRLDVVSKSLAVSTGSRGGIVVNEDGSRMVVVSWPINSPTINAIVFDTVSNSVICEGTLPKDTKGIAIGKKKLIASIPSSGLSRNPQLLVLDADSFEEIARVPTTLREDIDLVEDRYVVPRTTFYSTRPIAVSNVIDLEHPTEEWKSLRGIPGRRSQFQQREQPRFTLPAARSADGIIRDGMVFDQAGQPPRLMISPPGFQTFNSNSGSSNADRLAWQPTERKDGIRYHSTGIELRLSRQPVKYHGGAQKYRISLTATHPYSRDIIREWPIAIGNYESNLPAGVGQLCVHKDTAWVFVDGEVVPIALSELHNADVPLKIATRQSELIIGTSRGKTSLTYEVSGGTPPYTSELTCASFNNRFPVDFLHATKSPETWEVDGSQLSQYIVEKAQDQISPGFSGFTVDDVPMTKTYTSEVSDWYRKITGKTPKAVPYMLNFSYRVKDAAGDGVVLFHTMFIEIPPQEVERVLEQRNSIYRKAGRNQ